MIINYRLMIIKWVAVGSSHAGWEGGIRNDLERRGWSTDRHRRGSSLRLVRGPPGDLCRALSGNADSGFDSTVLSSHTRLGGVARGPLGLAGGGHPGGLLAASRTAGGLGRRRAGIRGLDCGARRVAGPAAGEPDVSLGRAACRDLTVLERTSETPGRVRLLRLSGAPASARFR